MIPKRSGQTARAKAQRRKGFVILFWSFVLLSAPTVNACNVPVFRYALERWVADTYTLVLYTDGNIKPGVLARLQKHAVDADSLSNYRIQTVDITSPEGERIAKANNVTTMPWMALYYPPNAQVRGLVWQGALNEENVQRLIHSPARSATAEKLLAGEVAIWLFVGSGDAERDNPARQILERTLERASRELKIPSAAVDINGNPITVENFVDYDVHFDILDVDRHDPAESFLLAMLLASESDLIYYDEPMAFPVFGRGRALYALVGAGITEKTVFAACRSMTAWCSCEIKAQHPGIDLLITADWSQPVGGQMVQDEELPPLTGLGEFVAAETDTKSLPEETLVPAPENEPVASDTILSIQDTTGHAAMEAQKPTSPNSLFRNLIVLLAFGIVLVLISTIIVKVKKSKTS